MSGYGRPGLPRGSWGSISCHQVAPSKYKARARFCDADGVTRTVARFGQSKGAATKRLREALAERAQHGRIDYQTTLHQLALLWLEQTDRRDDLAGRTVEHYHYIVSRRIKSGPLGKLRVADATTGVCDNAIQSLAAHSKAEAKTLRSILNGMFRLAVSHGAVMVNPIREVGPINTRRGKPPPRALSVAEVENLSDLLRTDPRAVVLDLADMAEWMLGTGCRIGETLAVRDECLDLDAGTVAINRTLVRLQGRGLVLEPPKTPASNRLLLLPSHLVAMVRRRRDEIRFHAPDRVLFPSPFGPRMRDPSNTMSDLREVFDRIGCTSCEGRGWHPALKTEKQNAKRPKVSADEHGRIWHEDCDGKPPYAWLTSHKFRKTAATRLDEGGQSARQVADQLGQTDVSVTQNVYFGRGVANPEAARILDR